MEEAQKTYDPSKVLKASYDPRFDYTRHFIMADIDKAFLDKHKIVAYVNDFKARVRKSKPVFYALAGNLQLAKNYRQIAVYDIYDFVPKEEHNAQS